MTSIIINKRIAEVDEREKGYIGKSLQAELFHDEESLIQKVWTRAGIGEYDIIYRRNDGTWSKPIWRGKILEAGPDKIRYTSHKATNELDKVGIEPVTDPRTSETVEFEKKEAVKKYGGGDT